MVINKKIRRYLWIFSALFKRHRPMILWSFIGGLVIFVLFIRVLPVLANRLQTQAQVLGVVGSYTPTTMPLSIQHLLSMGLTNVSPAGEAQPAAAVSWDINSDGKEYTFHLRQDLKWHDGKTFSAFDVNYNLKDVQFVPINDFTLKVQLKQPFVPLPLFLSKPLFRKGMVGLGVYRVQSIKLKGEHFSYLELVPKVGDLPYLTVKFYQTEEAAKLAFKLGEASILDEITEREDFSDWKTVNIIENKKYNQYVGIFFNVNDQLLKDKEIRQGLAFALKKPEMDRIMTPLSTQSWAYTTRVKEYEYDEEAAAELLQDAKDREITLSTFPQFLNLANEIAASWQELGLKTKIKVVSGVSNDFQALLAVQEIPPDPDQYNLWHSTQDETNITYYSNPKIDKLLEDGRKEPDIEKRKKIYFDFQRYLVEDAPAVFLFHPTTYTIKRK